MAKKRWKMKCLVGSLYIRSAPSNAGKTIGVLKNGDIITTSEEVGGWYKHDKGGWSFGGGGKYLGFIIDLDTNTASPKPVTKKEAETEKPPLPPKTEQPSLGYEPNLETYDGLSTGLTSRMTFKEVRGLHGVPYQYMPHVDRRLNSDKGQMFYGRKFADKIMTKVPMLVLTPGRPAFMSGFSKKYKDNIMANMFETFTNRDSISINELLNGDKSGKYYTFEFAYADYYKSVNSMCRQMALFMGLGDYKIDGIPLKRYDWSKYINKEMKGYISGNEYVCFYIDSDTEISESFSNGTGESMLSSGLNQLSDLGKEVGFLLGAGAGLQVDAMSSENYESNMEAISKLVGDYTSPGHIVERLKSGMTTIAAGGELIFPEIWKDSSYSKSYDISIKLTTPNPSNVGIFFDIMVPMLHLLAFAMPVQLGYNGFTSPFLTRGFYKGFFSCEMGIITDLSISKGGEGLWNVNGLPTSIKIDMNLKDLYQILAMSRPKDLNPTEFLKNTPMIDFLANMAGVNINKPELFRSLGMYKDALIGNITNIPNNIYLDITNHLSNTFDKFGRFLN